MYPGAAYVSAPADWKEFTAEIKGQVKSGSPSKQWWPGARKGKIVIFSVWNNPPKCSSRISLSQKNNLRSALTAKRVSRESGDTLFA